MKKATENKDTRETKTKVKIMTENEYFVVSPEDEKKHKKREKMKIYRFC